MDFKIRNIVLLVIVCIGCSQCVNSLQQRIDKADSYYNRGIEYSLQGESHKALACYDSALMFHQRPEYFTMRGASKMSLDDTIGAIADLKESIKIDSIGRTALRAYEGLAQLYFYQNEYEQVIHYGLRANSIEPNTISLSDIGLTYYKMGDYENAFETLYKALESKRAAQPLEIMGVMGECGLKLGLEKEAAHWLNVADSLGSKYASHLLDSLQSVKR